MLEGFVVDDDLMLDNLLLFTLIAQAPVLSHLVRESISKIIFKPATGTAHSYGNRQQSL